MEDNPLAVAVPPSPRQDQSFRRGRRGGSGPDQRYHRDDRGRGAGFRGGRGDRERGARRDRGRGSLDRNNIPDAPAVSHAISAPPAKMPALGRLSGNITEDDSWNVGKARVGNVDQTEEAIADDGEGDICFICASSIEYTCIAPCNHQTCHICSLRLRALYKTRACAHCRVSKIEPHLVKDC